MKSSYSDIYTIIVTFLFSSFLLISCENRQKAMELLDKGTQKYQSGEYIEAINCFDQVIDLYPDIAGNAYFGRAMAETNLGLNHKALSDLDRAISINPNDIEAFISRGVLKRDLDDYSGSLNDFDNAVLLDPKNPRAYSFRSITKSKMNDFPGAINDVDKAIELNPDDDNLYTLRGITNLTYKDYNAAIKDFNIAIKMNHQNPRNYYGIAVAQKEINDNLSAIKNLINATMLGSSEAKDMLLRCYPDESTHIEDYIRH
jgi:tetratricopeptide (TPR) repeat protein